MDRRFAVIAAGAEDLEPASDYGVDLLTGDRRRDEDIRMAVAYVKFCHSVAACRGDQLVSQYPHVVSALADIPELSSRAALDRICDLHRRHADNVLGVIEGGVKRHGRDLVRDDLPARSLLALCVGRSRIAEPPTLDYDQQMMDLMDRLGFADLRVRRRREIEADLLQGKPRARAAPTTTLCRRFWKTIVPRKRRGETCHL